MRESLRWSMMRLLMGLCDLVPCAFLTRLRAHQTSYCMSHMWSDLR